MTGQDAYDSTPVRGTPLEWTRVYRSGGRHAHLREESGGLIACSVWRFREGGWEAGWLGTGSQDEYEHAAGLPLCLGCFAVRESGQFGITDDPARDEGYQ